MSTGTDVFTHCRTVSERRGSTMQLFKMCASATFVEPFFAALQMKIKIYHVPGYNFLAACNGPNCNVPGNIAL